MKKNAYKLNFCRLCKNKQLKKVFSLNSTPPANAFLTKRHLQGKEEYFPLAVNFCKKCGQLQLTHVVSPVLLFRDYVYASSTSPVFIAHFEEYAKSIYQRFKLDNSSLVVDIGSNDGILLKPFRQLGTRVLGIDPALEIAKEATRDGLETLPVFFDQPEAKKILQKFGPAKIITANNVFAHVDNLDELVSAVKILLDQDGVFIIEAPYLVDFLEKNLFDTVYHEHLSYLSIRPLRNYFQTFHQMDIFRVEKTDSHGGSIRIFVRKDTGTQKIDQSVEDFIKLELSRKLHHQSTYLRFAKKINRNKEVLTKLLKKLKSKHKSIIGYGAPAKGNTMLNYFKIGPKILDFIIDDSKYKQGLYTPGTHILVASSDKLNSTKPDYILILAWNFADPIMKKLSDYKKSGGHFIIPVPKPKIV